MFCNFIAQKKEIHQNRDAQGFLSSVNNFVIDMENTSKTVGDLWVSEAEWRILEFGATVDREIKCLIYNILYLTFTICRSN